MEKRATMPEGKFRLVDDQAVAGGFAMGLQSSFDSIIRNSNVRLVFSILVCSLNSILALRNVNREITWLENIIESFMLMMVKLRLLGKPVTLIQGGLGGRRDQVIWFVYFLTSILRSENEVLISDIRRTSSTVSVQLR